MNDSEIIDKAAKIFFKNAITRAVNDTFYNLQRLLGIGDGDYNPDTAIHLQAHLETLVQDYCDILNDQMMS